jgi:hypothetical protein
MLTYGLLSNVTLGTEHLRWLGELRLTLGALREILRQRGYGCRVAYLPADAPQAAAADRVAARRAAAAAGVGGGGGRDGCVLPLPLRLLALLWGSASRAQRLPGTTLQCGPRLLRRSRAHRGRPGPRGPPGQQQQPWKPCRRQLPSRTTAASRCRCWAPWAAPCRARPRALAARCRPAGGRWSWSRRRPSVSPTCRGSPSSTTSIPRWAARPAGRPARPSRPLQERRCCCAGAWRTASRLPPPAACPLTAAPAAPPPAARRAQGHIASGRMQLVYTQRVLGRWEGVKLLLAAKRGAHLACPGVACLPMRAMVLEPLSDETRVALDGQPVAGKPLYLELLPGLCRAVVAPGFGGPS